MTSKEASLQPSVSNETECKFFEGQSSKRRRFPRAILERDPFKPRVGGLRYETRDHYGSIHSADDKRPPAFYQDRYEKEMLKTTESLREAKLAEAFFEKAVEGKISFSEAVEITKSKGLIMSASNLEYFLYAVGGRKREGIDLTGFVLAVHEMHRVKTNSEALESDLSKIRRKKKWVPAIEALAKMRDAAPHYPEEKLLNFVLRKSNFQCSRVNLKEYARAIRPIGLIWQQADKERASLGPNVVEQQIAEGQPAGQNVPAPLAEENAADHPIEQIFAAMNVAGPNFGLRPPREFDDDDDDW